MEIIHTLITHTVCRKWCAWMQRRISIFSVYSFAKNCFWLRYMRWKYTWMVWDLEYESIKNSKSIFVPFPHIPRSSCLFDLYGFLSAVVVVVFFSSICDMLSFKLFEKYTTPSHGSNTQWDRANQRTSNTDYCCLNSYFTLFRASFNSLQIEMGNESSQQTTTANKKKIHANQAERYR